MQTTIGALPSHKPGCRPGLAVPRFYSRPALAARPSTAASLQNPEQQSLAADDCRLPQRTLVAALIALTTATALPWQADAKKTEPPPKPTTYDELQKIISGRSGSSGSLLESFKKGVAAPVTNALKSGPQLPAAPALKGTQKSEPVSKPPQGPAFNPATAIEKRLEQKAPSIAQGAEASAPPPAVLAIVGALGLGGLAFLFNKNKAGKASPAKAARSAAPKFQAGAKRAGKQAARQAPAPVKAAFNSAKKQGKQPAKAAGGLFSSAKSQAKQPAKAAGGLFGSAKAQVQKPAKAAGGLFGGGKPASPKQAIKKLAPSATRKIQRPGTQKVGTQRIGTQRVGGAQPSKRLQVDEDTSLTLGAASVFGLTVVVGAFLVVSALTSSDVAADVAATAKETTQEAARKLPAVPKPLPVSLPGALDQAPPKIAPPLPGVPPPPVIQQGPPQTPKGPDMPGEALNKPESGMPLAPLPSEGNTPTAPNSPDLLIQPRSSDSPRVSVAEAVKAAPRVAAETAQQAAPQVAQKLQDAIPSPPPTQEARKQAPAVAETVAQAAPAVAETVTQAAPSVAQKAQEAVPEIAEESPKSAAFEAATKKLSASPSFAEQMKAAAPAPAKKTAATAASTAAAGPAKAFNSLPSPAPASKNQSGLILGALAAAAVVGVAVAAPKGNTPSLEGNSSSGSSSSSNSTGGVSDDIAQRKQEARAWIEDWRKRSGSL